jgi:hypothetical protein
MARFSKLSRYLGALGALLVPAAVFAQLAPFSASERLTSDRLNGMVEAINGGAGHARCRVAAQTSCAGTPCTALCPADFVVNGGGCRMNAAGTIKAMTPGFDPASVDLNVNNGFPAPGSFDGAAADPLHTAQGRQWDRYVCEAAEGTIQTVYAICCPL